MFVEAEISIEVEKAESSKVKAESKRRHIKKFKISNPTSKIPNQPMPLTYHSSRNPPAAAMISKLTQINTLPGSQFQAMI